MPRRRRPPRSGAIAELPPLRILGQIAALQGIYYAVALVLMLFTSLVMGLQFSLDMVFGWASLRGDNTQGWLMGFVWLCCAGAVVVALVVLISRSKLVLDFSLTLHILHLIIVSIYTGYLPRNMAWWITMLVSGTITVAGGTYGCRWRELRPITFGGISRNTENSSNGSPEDGSGDHGDEEMGFSRGGRGRGRGRDGLGEYEMASIKGDSNK
ncbi:integral membrane protein S linking to the trans Golgi network-domain-containing protein [Xylaria bambusicola]|uniref:integral membrane protein S linking to the trans Golgi network-domain-containing protein n=1 Tax=Xylaria bambusicola TaxID=326684 RepID=UPI0020079043|nr:integral membrane protein S linking to the trans Golgi network-domain-containing protein [Xylaria bambusicola]KAI0509552.1 integral membrane protein S linking to the trans Golgi network-domain-containing protein [Xylaria bambusicola]